MVYVAVALLYLAVWVVFLTGHRRAVAQAKRQKLRFWRAVRALRPNRKTNKTNQGN